MQLTRQTVSSVLASPALRRPFSRSPRWSTLPPWHLGLQGQSTTARLYARPTHPTTPLLRTRRKTRHAEVAQHGQSSPSIPAHFPTARPTESGCRGQTGCSAHRSLQGFHGTAEHRVAPKPPVRAGAQTTERGRRPPKAAPMTSVSASHAESPPEVPTSYPGPHGESLPWGQGCQNTPAWVAKHPISPTFCRVNIARVQYLFERALPINLTRRIPTIPKTLQPDPR